MTSQSAAERLGRVVKRLVAYRGWSSPEALDMSYRPRKAPVSGGTIRRIAAGTWTGAANDEELFLVRLAGMLNLPLSTLELVYAGDVAGVERLAFEDEALRQFILDAMKPPETGRKRAAR